ncbi:MAG: carbohydrate kinase family protein [Sphingobacteriaceae bacterium]
MPHVVCFGEILWDNFFADKKPGGAPMNVALHLYKQGITSTLISSIGTDQNGEELKEFLTGQGLSTAYIQKHNNLPTGTVDITLDENKQATYTIAEPVAWDEIAYNEKLTQLIKATDALVFGSLACRNPTSRKTLLKLLDHAKLSVFDMNLRPPHFEPAILKALINKCTILKINEHELSYLEGIYSLEKDIDTQLKQLSYLTNTPTICITLGDKGAIILNEGEIQKHPGFQIEVADTVGAGDAFLAAFLSGYFQKLPVQQILVQACATGALVASKHGANPNYSTAEIEAIIKF